MNEHRDCPVFCLVKKVFNAETGLQMVGATNEKSF